MNPLHTGDAYVSCDMTRHAGRPLSFRGVAVHEARWALSLMTLRRWQMACTWSSLQGFWVNCSREMPDSTTVTVRRVEFWKTISLVFKTFNFKLLWCPVCNVVNLTCTGRCWHWLGGLTEIVTRQHTSPSNFRSLAAAAWDRSIRLSQLIVGRVDDTVKTGSIKLETVTYDGA